MRGGTFSCPECGREGCKAYDTTWKQWRHLNFFQHEAHLHAPVPRVQCPEHGIKQAEVPWARPDSGFTLLFEAFALALVKEMPVAAVALNAPLAAAYYLKEDLRRLWNQPDKSKAGRLLKDWIARARSRSTKRVM